ncbi:MAG: preprotein translocase subunit YajC [Prevotella sp.]|nr:preprotein translocase subunit YajC [Prevotella sp.]MBR4925272.1 preprotein translocase subunit YajC [Prevotella sp.]
MTTSMFLQAAEQGQGGGWTMILMLLAIFAIMYFFMIRPQQNQQKKIRAFQNSLEEGTRVVVGGGIHGIVKRIDNNENAIEVEIAKGVTIKVDRGYVFADNTGAAATQQK